MLCNVILSFILVYIDGHTETRIKWMDRPTAEYFVSDIIISKEFIAVISDEGIIKIMNIKITNHATYNCEKGPK